MADEVYEYQQEVIKKRNKATRNPAVRQRTQGFLDELWNVIMSYMAERGIEVPAGEAMKQRVRQHREELVPRQHGVMVEQKEREALRK